MIHARLFRDDPASILNNLQKRHQSQDFDPEALKKELQEIAQIQPQSDELKNERNRLSKEIGRIKKEKGDAAQEMARVQEIGNQIKELDQRLQQLQEKTQSELLGYPNILLEEVPAGADESENVELKQVGEHPDFPFQPLGHDILGEKLAIMDFKAGGKIAGSKFPVYLNQGSLLERAIINLMLDTHTREHGYSETTVPLLVNDESMRGTGQYPKFIDEYYRLDKDGLSLIPTAEVPLTNLYRDTILEPDEIPAKVTAFSSCFRREAGSYGKETKGLVRVHQFQKVELVKICRPEDSEKEHQALLQDAEAILQKLKLPYRVMLLCGGDTSGASAKTYDIEVWMPGMNRYLEISSVSNFTDYQARRAQIRYRPESGAKPQLAHTLNGSGLAAGRTMAAIIENYQNPDGSISIPEALQGYMHGLKEIRAD